MSAEVMQSVANTSLNRAQSRPPSPSQEPILSPTRERRLFVLWHDRREQRFFSIAQLVRRADSPRYEFRYLPGLGAARAQGLEPLLSFPDRDRVYASDHLFPFFENRLMRRSRPDYADYVQRLDLDPATAGDMDILGRSGGERATDAFLLVPEPEPAPGMPGTFCLLFFAAHVLRLRGAAWQHLSTLKAGDRLTWTADGALRHGELDVGRLPGHIQALPFLAGATIDVVRNNAQRPRQSLLCRLTFSTDHPAAPWLAPQPLSPAIETSPGPTSEPRRPTQSSRSVSPLLAALIEHLAEGNRPQLPCLLPVADGDPGQRLLPPPVSGSLLGRPLPAGDYRLRLDPERYTLRLQGSDREFGHSLRSEAADVNAEAFLDLADGSTILDARTGSLSRGSENWCDLPRWLWLAPSIRQRPVRYWVGVTADAELSPFWLNVDVATLFGQGLHGLHIEGEPTWTLLKLRSAGQTVEHSNVALIIEADPRSGAEDADVTAGLYEATSCLGLVTGIREPCIFYGYDADQQICAAFVRMESLPRAAITEPGLPVRPLSASKNERERQWPVPFLSALREALRDRERPRFVREALFDAVIYYLWALEDSVVARELAQMGVAIRALLRTAPGVTRPLEDLIRPDQVTDALRRWASLHRLRLPDGAAESLELAHRMALFGEFALGTQGIDARGFWRFGHWESEQETLRTLFATLLAGAIRYYGPVVGRLGPIRSESEPHQPWLELDDSQKARREEQEALASAFYGVGGGDGELW